MDRAETPRHDAPRPRHLLEPGRQPYDVPPDRRLFSHHVIASTIIVTTRGSPTNAQPRDHTKAHESRIGRHATNLLSPDRSTTLSSEPSPEPSRRGLSPYGSSAAASHVK